MAKRICVLEDDDSIRELIELLLREEHYEVLGFSRVAEFFADENIPQASLFLLDVHLPDGDGMAVCKLLKSFETTRNIPVLMMSAHADERLLDQTCRPDGFVAKPFDINELISRVQHSLNA